MLADVYGREPTHWRVFVQCQNGKYEWLETCETSTAVESLVDRLVVIDAYTKENEHERLTAFARIHEKKARNEKYILAAKTAVADNTVQEQQQEQYVSLPSLAAISAYAKANEHEWVAAFVRTHEKQPRHDKDILAAKTTVADSTVQEQQQEQDVALPSITVSEKYGSICRISRKMQRNTPQAILQMGIALFLGTRRKSVGMQGLVLTLTRSNNGCLAMKPSQQI